MKAGSAYYCKRVTYVVVADVEADIPLVRVNTQVGYRLSQFGGVSVERSVFTVLLPTGGQVTRSQLIQVPVLILYHKHTRTRHHYCTRYYITVTSHFATKQLEIRARAYYRPTQWRIHQGNRGTCPPDFRPRGTVMQ